MNFMHCSINPVQQKYSAVANSRAKFSSLITHFEVYAYSMTSSMISFCTYLIRNWVFGSTLTGDINRALQTFKKMKLKIRHKGKTTAQKSISMRFSLEKVTCITQNDPMNWYAAAVIEHNDCIAKNIRFS